MKNIGNWQVCMHIAVGSKERFESDIRALFQPLTIVLDIEDYERAADQHPHCRIMCIYACNGMTYPMGKGKAQLEFCV